MGISKQSTLLCEQKLLTSRQIFRYAVPARTVTKKALGLPPVNGTVVHNDHQPGKPGKVREFASDQEKARENVFLPVFCNHV